MLSSTLHILFAEPQLWMPELVQHLELSLVALVISCALGLAVGFALTRAPRIAFAVTNIANLGRTIPSLALLALVYPFVGTGFAPSVIALVALGIPPIALAAFTGVQEVDAGVRDAALGMGLSNQQLLTRVEIPMAMPIVLSGIRTSAVQIVASATLAALIGGGALGEMILAGLANLQMGQLVAGAILVAILAIATEVGFAFAERRLVPVGLQSAGGRSSGDGAGGGGGDDYRAGAGIDGRRWLGIFFCIACGAAVLSIGGSRATRFIATAGMNQGGWVDSSLPTIKVGSKNFTEQLVLGEMYSQALRSHGFPVVEHLDLGATAVADAAVRGGRIDLYPEYTGTSLTEVLHKNPAHGVTGPQVYRMVKTGYAKRGLTVLKATPFENGNTIVVTQATAKKYHLKTLSDLAKVASKMTFGAVPGFDTRDDGMPLLKSTYGLHFGAVKTYNVGLRYAALADGKINAAYGFSTDGQIAHYHLVVLRDDKHMWPPYHVTPIVRDQLAQTKAGAKLATVLNGVDATLTDTIMQHLNDMVDEQHADPAVVAHDYLTKHHLLGSKPKS